MSLFEGKTSFNNIFFKIEKRGKSNRKTKIKSLFIFQKEHFSIK